ncbi:CHAD domain-containing protein [Lysobacter rhizosphaerae]
MSAELEAAAAGLDASAGHHLHAGVHRARKGIRRARAALALGDPVLGPGAILLERELRRVNRSLSELRDAQALVEVLGRLAAKARDEPTLRVLRRALRKGKAGRAAMARRPELAEELARTRALLATLCAALTGLPWDGISPAQLAEALARSSQRIDSARGKVCDDGSMEDWHRWRRRMRRLSQQHRACVGAGLEWAASLFDKSLAEQLGVMQDLRLLLEHCGSDSPFAPSDREALKRFAKTAWSRQRDRIASVTKTEVGAAEN